MNDSTLDEHLDKWVTALDAIAKINELELAREDCFRRYAALGVAFRDVPPRRVYTIADLLD